EGQLQQATVAITTLEEENKRCKESNKQDMALLANLCISLEGHTERSYDLLLQIDQLPSNTSQNAPQETTEASPVVLPNRRTGMTDEVVNIDAKLPPALVRVLQEAFSGN